MQLQNSSKSNVTDTFSTVSYDLSNRRNDLELLRIVALFILIFYHTGMLYVSGWGFHYKSEYQSEMVANWMLLVNPWRMSLLWLISGVALRHALHKYGAWHSLQQRCVRLLLPLLFGVLVVVPPQLYIEMAGKAQLPSDLSYWDFYQAFWHLKDPLFAQYKSGILPHMDVNHLWYLRELWKFSLLLIVVHFFWKSLSLRFPLAIASVENRMKHVFAMSWQGAAYSGLLIAALVVLDIVHLDDRNNTGFLFLLAGYALASTSSFWQHVFENRKGYLIAAGVFYVLLLCVYNFLALVPERNAWPWVDPVSAIVYRSYGGFCIMAALGYARYFGEQFQQFSQRWSEAVLPVYVVHQSLILIAAYCLKPYTVGAWLEPILVITFTCVTSCLIYYVVARINILRVCFGLKWKLTKQLAVSGTLERNQREQFGQKLRKGLAYILLVPLALKLIL
ncbi:acyltransferase family protein [Undibacterium sp. Di24W]|uniref:acyltransferase family protein n=1 Tax=Undibacterium sp. Di24W TaxID=3413033 RepID=UPI003BF054BA